MGAVDLGQLAQRAAPDDRIGIDRQGRDQGQGPAGRRIARLAQRPGVVDQVILVGGIEALEAGGYGGEARVVILYAGIGRGAGIDQRARARDVGLLLQHQFLRPRLRHHGQRNAPRRYGGRGRRIEHEPADAEMGAGRGRRDLDQRQAGLAGEVVFDVDDRGRAARRHFAPQVIVDRIAEGVLFHIGADAVTKRVGPGIGLQHGDDRGALVIGDVVEGLAGLLGAVDFLQHRVGRRGGVGRLTGLEDALRLQARAPFRMQGVGGIGLHPAGKPFVEPQIVPPLHGHQVAEPLVRHLVRDHQKDQLPVGVGRIGGVVQQVFLRIEVGAPVFHRAALDLARRGDQVELEQREGRAEIGVVVMQDVDGLAQRILAARRIAALDDDAQVDAVDALVDALIIADRQEQQIGRHRRRFLERRPRHLFSVRAIPDRHGLVDRHIGHGHLVERRVDRHRKARLVAGFVPRRNEAACRRRFEIGGQGALFSGRRVVVHGEEAERRRQDRRMPGHVQGVGAGRHRLGEGEGHLAWALVLADFGRLGAVQRHRVERQALGVQGDRRRLRGHLDIDCLVAGIGEGGRIGDDVDVVVHRLDRLRQHLACRRGCVSRPGGPRQQRKRRSTRPTRHGTRPRTRHGITSRKLM